jgi:plastocyanin
VVLQRPVILLEERNRQPMDYSTQSIRGVLKVTELLRNRTSFWIRNDHNRTRKTMKLHSKFAFLICCAATISLLSSRADTIQVQVGVGGAKFTPQSVTINVGDTVEWTWAGNNHSTTSGTPGNPDGLWDSGVHNIGFVFSRTFTTAGTFNYFCAPHGLCCGMIGSVIVAEVDTVQITRAQYAIARSQLTVQATDTNETAMLTVSVTSSGQVLGPMINRGGGSYTAKFTGISNPQNITVTSNLGGSDSARVRAR